MRKIDLLPALLVLLLVGCDGPPPPSTPPQSSEEAAAITTAPTEPDPTKLEALKKAIKAEPQVIDFVYDPLAQFQWTIGVKNDGSLRYGYAEYICLLIGEHGLRTKSTHVRIVDYLKYTQPGGNGRDASLGGVDCETSQQIFP